MKPHSLSPLKRLALALLLPLVLVLSACELAMTLTFHENDTLDAEVVVGVPKALTDASDGELSCDTFAEEFNSDPNAVVTDESTDSMMRCAVRSREPQPYNDSSNGLATTQREGDKYITTVHGDQSELDDAETKLSGFEPDFSFTFIYPGPVEKVETTLSESEYTVSGNTVNLHSMKAIGVTTVITASAVPGSNTDEATPSESPDSEESSTPAADENESASTPPAASANESDSDDSNTMWWWIGGIALALVIVGAIAYAVAKSKRNNANNAAWQSQGQAYPATQPGGYPNQQGGYPNQPGGYPTQQGGYPNQQGGYPNQQGGYPNQQGGYPNQQSGYPNQQGGYPTQQGGYPNQQGTSQSGGFAPPTNPSDPSSGEGQQGGWSQPPR